MGTFRSAAIITIIALTASDLSAQRTEVHLNTNQADSQGRKHGDWVYFYSRFDPVTGPVKFEEGRYEHGKRTGRWLTYHFSEAVKSEVIYEHGRITGPKVAFYDNGQLREKGNWENGHWVGSYVYYYPNGQMMHDWSYNENGRRHGEQLSFHRSGELWLQDNWENGVREGIMREYDLAGRLVRESNYVAGVVTLVSETTDRSHRYDSSGSPLAIIPDGQMEVFDRQGRLLKKGEFRGQSLYSGEQFIYGDKGLFRVATVKGGIVVDTRRPKSMDRNVARGTNLN